MENVRRIHKLDEHVIHRIAAGEIIHRPANALKEMIENSLDAGATLIQIMVKDGGLKLLQIQDNGSGILKEDLPLVCERFATSKLKKFEDLSTIDTFGFRGEALASISHIAHVTLVTKTASSSCAYKARYADGKLIPIMHGEKAEPRPCAGNNGTQIIVEELFYNVPIRMKAVKNPSEEYNKILDVVHRYAIHATGVSFNCKKIGSTVADVSTSTAATTLDTIGQIFGPSISKELLTLKYEDERYEFSLEGFISNANFSIKKSHFLLFINHRAVECANMKRALESMYSQYLPKLTYPFIYLSLTIKPQNLDVNVHPTKREVHFLNEEAIIGKIVEIVQQRLSNANASRSFLTQKLLVQPISSQHMESMQATSLGSSQDNRSNTTSLGTPIHPSHLVRSDGRLRTLHSFALTSSSMGSSQASSIAPISRITLPSFSSASCGNELDTKDLGLSVPSDSSPLDIRPIIRTSLVDEAVSIPSFNGQSVNKRATSSQDNLVESSLLPKSKRVCNPIQSSSIDLLIEDVNKHKHDLLTEIFRKHSFVGCIDNRFALIQYQTKLYLVDYCQLSKQLFYQLFVHFFANFGIIHLQPSADIRKSLLLHLEIDVSSTDKIEDDNTVANTITQLLKSKADMLQTSFGIEIDCSSGHILTLPLVMKNYVPDLTYLPSFLYALGTQVDWEHEEPCIDVICTLLADLYSLHPPCHFDDSNLSKTDEAYTQSLKIYRRNVEHFIFPHLRSFFMPSSSLVSERHVLQIADLPDLYKVFERC